MGHLPEIASPAPAGWVREAVFDLLAGLIPVRFAREVVFALSDGLLADLAPPLPGAAVVGPPDVGALPTCELRPPVYIARTFVIRRDARPPPQRTLVVATAVGHGS